MAWRREYWQIDVPYIVSQLIGTRHSNNYILILIKPYPGNGMLKQ